MSRVVVGRIVGTLSVSYSVKYAWWWLSVVIFRNRGWFILSIISCCCFGPSLSDFFLIVGDFNFCHQESVTPTKKFLEESNFSQLIKKPTHIAGNIIDQAHVRDIKKINAYTEFVHTKYYTNHKALAILIKKKSDSEEP